jgi:hypothetical protein
MSDEKTTPEQGLELHKTVRYSWKNISIGLDDLNV